MVSFVNQIMRTALEERATDIHVEPLENDLRIRYRIDGVLHEVPVPSKIKMLQASVLSRIKIMANLDIAERRMPQDGRINLEMEGQPIDVRVATIPTVSGESISLRLLARNKFDFSLLGLTPAAERKIRELISQPNGIILLTGPTGCGKSTSLYTFLSMLNTMERRIVTVEDPVEHKLPGVMQIAVKPEIDLTFATRVAQHFARRPERDHDRGNARLRDGGNRHPRGAHRPPRLLHAPHQRRHRRHHASRRHGRAAVPGRLVGARIPGPAPRARALPELQEAGAPLQGIPRTGGIPDGARLRVMQAAGCEECRQPATRDAPRSSRFASSRPPCRT